MNEVLNATTLLARAPIVLAADGRDALLQLWARLGLTQPSIVYSRQGSGPNIRISGGPALAIIVGTFALIVFLIVRFILLRRRAAFSRERSEEAEQQLQLAQKRATQALARSEAHYRVLFDDNPAPMIIYDFDTTGIVEVNAMGAAQYGYSRDELQRMTIRDLCARDELERVDVALRTMNPRTSGTHVIRHRRKNGTEIYVETRGRPLEVPGQRLRLVVANDVTERLAADLSVREAEARSRATSEMLQSLIDAAPQAILVVDAELNVTGWNRAAEKLFGWTAGEVLGKAVPILRPEDRATAASRIETVAHGRPIEVVRLRKDGTSVDVLLAAAPVIDSAGARAGYIAVFTDLTERKLLEEQLRQSQKMEAIGTLAGGIAHDFNNILTVITSYSSMLLETPGRSETDRADLEEIATAANRASALTRQLLTFTRKAIVRPRPIDASEVVMSMESMLRRLLRSNIELTTRLTSDACCVVADPSQLEQIIMNLVVNASDAMPSGGSLAIETTSLELDETYAQMHSGIVPGEYVVLTIADTGIGMDAETRQKIFEPFFTTKEAGRGTGLGLATVYGIVKQLGGGIWVYSEPGHGATFKIYLPRETDGAAPTDVSSPLPPSRQTGTVLLVEDDDGVRRAVRRMLENVGYDVLEASDGEAGLARAQSHPGLIDVVVTDVMMPNMGGQALVTALSKTRPSINVVFTSGYADTAVLRRGLIDSTYAFLQKPFTGEQLVSTIRALVDARNPE